MRAALKRETKIELEEKGHGPIKNESLIHPSKRILALGTLYSSLVSVSYLLYNHADTDGGNGEIQ